MLVSIIIPACDAQAHIERAVRSVITQTWPSWEAVIVCDDAFDYSTFLAARGVTDSRLRFVSTGAIRSGCHHARNVGYETAQGDLMADLDADDLFDPQRLAKLVPLAQKYGAAADNIAVVSDHDGVVLYHPFNEKTDTFPIDATALFELTCPLFPVVRRDAARPRSAGIEYAEDVVANLQLIGRLGTIIGVSESLSEYRVVAGSLSHDIASATRFDAGYADIVDRAARGALGLPADLQETAVRGFTRKRALNRIFGEALKGNPALNFQTFVASRRA